MMQASPISVLLGLGPLVGRLSLIETFAVAVLALDAPHQVLRLLRRNLVARVLSPVAKHMCLCKFRSNDHKGHTLVQDSCAIQYWS